ncbi:hypothetical protein G210_4838, partial [Candida maltosa Xu316]
MSKALEEKKKSMWNKTEKYQTSTSINMAIDELIKNKWYESYTSYCETHNLPVDETITKPDATIDITSDIPLLSDLINNQPNSQQLTQELKSALLKFYWSGFELGYESKNRA